MPTFHHPITRRMCLKIGASLSIMIASFKHKKAFATPRTAATKQGMEPALMVPTAIQVIQKYTYRSLARRPTNILVKVGLRVIPILKSIEILKFTRGGRFISDHFGLHVQFEQLVQVDF